MAPCIFRALVRPLTRLAAAAGCALLALATHSALAAQPHSVDQDGAEPPRENRSHDAPAGAFVVVRRFDFDERPQGNYEETPANWVRLEGDGLPRYSIARLDDDCGRLAPPSFRFDVQGGSIAYQYIADDLPLAPGAEHLVVGYARAVGLRQARAFLQLTLVDEVGQRLPGGDRVSNLIGSTLLAPDLASAAATDDGQSGEPWQRFEVVVPTDVPDAAAVRLTLWVMQAYAWREPAAVDPILRQDIGARVWFDDLVLYRLPRVDLHLSTPAPLVYSGAPATFIIDVHNPTGADLRYELSISDAAGRTLHMVRGAVPERIGPPLETPVPPLEPGTYAAQLRLFDESESFGNSSLRFAVIDELPSQSSNSTEFGIDLGELQPADAESLVELIRELGCGAVKLGLPMPDDSTANYDVEPARNVVRKLLSAGIDPAGVILPPTTLNQPASSTAQAALLNPNRATLLAPMLFPLGNAVSAWQIGDEGAELRGGAPWEPTALAELRGDIQRYVAVPEIVLPWSIFDAANRPAPSQDLQIAPNTASVYVPAATPTRALPAQLADLDPGSGDWLMLETDSTLPCDIRIAELARRLALAKAAGMRRVFVPAPLAYDAEAGRWYPTEEYVPLRTLFRFLAGKHPAAVVPASGPDALALLFADDADSACLVAWSWSDPPADHVALLGNESAELWDLWGRRQPVRSGEKTLVPLAAAPSVIAPINAAPIALQSCLAINPNFVAADDSEIRPVLKLTNPFAYDMVGTVNLTLPSYWRASRSDLPFRLASGEVFEQKLDFVVPPRETSGEKLVRVELDISAPFQKTLSMSMPVRLGLNNVSFDASAWWQGPDLMVEQVVRNHGQAALDFACSCQAPGRPQLEGAILGISPGSSSTQLFQIPNARELAGASLIVGLKDPSGRRLESLVTVPR